MFFDSQCDYCTDLWKQSQPLAGRLKIKWIPVGLLNATSLAQGAVILADKDPVKAMDRYYGVGVAPAPSDEGKRRVEANAKMLKAFGANGVPFLIYRPATTGQFGYASGTMDTNN